MRAVRADAGFTLVELMVVVLIIGILVAIVIPIVSGAKSSAQEKTCWANERTIEGEYQIWGSAGHDGTGLTDFDSLMGVLVPGLIKAPPRCPQSGEYSATFIGGVSQPNVVISCTVHSVHP